MLKEARLVTVWLGYAEMSYAESGRGSSFPTGAGTEYCDVRALCCGRSLIGSAICRGNCTIRSHWRQHRSANGANGANKKAAFCHSIAAVKGNRFFSSRCAAKQYLSARVAVPANANSLRTFHPGQPSRPLTNLITGFMPFTSFSELHTISYANAVAWITKSRQIYSRIRCCMGKSTRRSQPADVHI
jgi:hypothetical protein